MTNATISTRQTKYCQAIERILVDLGHASNAELLTHLRTVFPALTATTVHRASARLAERGAIGIAPAGLDGAMRYDHNTAPHDHFMCSSCGILRDTHIKDSIKPILEKAIDGCSISGQLTVTGLCRACTRKDI